MPCMQVGHAVCATLTAGHDPVQKVTLIPRGQARGLTWFTPDEDPSLISKQQIMARIVGALGGRAAEEIIFGMPEVTTGASSDLQQVGAGPTPLITSTNPACVVILSQIDCSVTSIAAFNAGDRGRHNQFTMLLGSRVCCTWLAC